MNKPAHCAGTGPKRHPRYQRHTELPGLVPMWPHEMKITCRRDHEKLLQCLRRTLRAERRRGVSGHWSYDLIRHTNLLHAYRTEMKLFAAKWGA